VVADEVRVLSQRTHESTEEISTMIQSFQSTTGSAVETMEGCQSLAENSVSDAAETLQSFDDIVESIRRINDLSSQIASAAEQQTSVTGDLDRNTVKIRSVSESFLEDARSNVEHAHSLEELSRETHQLISRFKLQ